jgi:hypothetical protein
MDLLVPRGATGGASHASRLSNVAAAPSPDGPQRSQPEENPRRGRDYDLLVARGLWAVTATCAFDFTVRAAQSESERGE